MMNDKTLCKLINDAVLKDERISGQPITVSIQKGIVALSGSVQTYRRKLIAQEIASSFEGCNGVINELVVEPSGPISDEDTSNSVRAALDAQADITKGTIAVSISLGVVSLNGNVGSHWERILAEDVARSARGVKDVRNLLVVDLPTKMEDKRLAEDIEIALSHAYGLKERKINVAVSEGAVVLSGEIPSITQKEMAEKVAHRFRFREIRNDIIVTGQ
jgi:osmotically-inducible protein OsmY